MRGEAEKGRAAVVNERKRARKENEEPSGSAHCGGERW